MVLALKCDEVLEENGWQIQIGISLYMGAPETPVKCTKLDDNSIQFHGLHTNVSEPIAGQFFGQGDRKLLINFAATKVNLERICRAFRYSHYTGQEIGSQQTNYAIDDDLNNAKKILGKDMKSWKTITCIEPGTLFA